MPRLPARPHAQHEVRLHLQGFTCVAGLDEVGRGTLAGPVLAGAVVFPAMLSGAWTKLVGDSKQLSPRQRDRAYDAIIDACVCYSTGACDSSEVDRLGIVPATRLAMARALDMLDTRPDCLLIDALDLPAIDVHQQSIIKGDAISISIAAASIIAKVTRDRLMESVFESCYPGYGFAEHKGYGTAEHLAALYKLGPTAAHRRTFAPVGEVLAARALGRRIDRFEALLSQSPIAVTGE